LPAAKKAFRAPGIFRFADGSLYLLKTASQDAGQAGCRKLPTSLVTPVGGFSYSQLYQFFKKYTNISSHFD